jgi:hypothetical protein
MKVKQIAAVVLILYAAITVAFVFHDHLKEQPGNHCNICQVLHAPAHTPVLTSYTPVLVAKGTYVPILKVSTNELLIFHTSERAPPTL